MHRLSGRTYDSPSTGRETHMGSSQDGSNVVLFPGAARRACVMEEVARLAPSRSLVASLRADEGLPEVDERALLKEAFLDQARSLQAGYGCDEAVVRLRAIVDLLAEHARAACADYHALGAETMRLEVELARRPLIGGPDRIALQERRARFRGAAIAAGAAADAALGAASALAFFVLEDAGISPNSATEPQQLPLFAVAR